jgi:hypothetical protein
LSFDDIYENKAKNDHIKELVGDLSAQRSIDVMATEVQQELACPLKYNSILANEQNENLGWWHRNVTSTGPIIYPEHKYSISWISAGTYNGSTYYDYKVAQHTNNYHAWTSSSTNGWETLTNVTYARVRR